MNITDGYTFKGPCFRKHKSLVTPIKTNNNQAIKIQPNGQSNSNGKQTLAFIKANNKEATIPPLNLLYNYDDKRAIKIKKADLFDNNPYQHTDVSSIEAGDDILSVSQCIQVHPQTHVEKTKSFIRLAKMSNGRNSNTEIKRRSVPFIKGFNDKSKENTPSYYEEQALMKGLVRTQTHTQSFKHNYPTEKTEGNANKMNDIDISSKDYSITSSFIANPTPLSLLASSTKFGHRRTISLNLNSSSSSSFQTIISYGDLLQIESDLHDIISVLTLKHPPEDQCLQWWYDYLHSSLKDNYAEFFLNEANKKKIKAYSNIELLCVLLCYILSTNKEVFNIYLKDFSFMFASLHFSFLLLIKFITIKQKGNDIQFDKINHMIKQSLSSINGKDSEEFNITSLITHNVTIISETYLNIINEAFRDSDDGKLLYDYLSKAYANLNCLQLRELNTFLQEVILREDLEMKYSGSSTRPKVPYLPIKTKYTYTIVLDLDETLVHLIDDRDGEFNDNGNNNRPAIDIRPGLFDFLKKLKGKYEVVLFTAGTQDYADTIIQIIEAKEKYFDYRLYREHTVIVDGEYIKDLWKLGRDLSRIIIVDDKPQNYQLQEENGILICPFYGGDCYSDTLGNLGNLLEKIFNEGGDVRDALVKYKDAIKDKITTGC